jgi:CubicO group peptidase (beta-lactamase class C family)
LTSLDLSANTLKAEDNSRYRDFPVSLYHSRELFRRDSTSGGNSVISAASFSKVAFAYLVMQLLDEGILSLDKPVYQYLPKPLPEYTAYKDLADEPRYRQITARMLLSHTSGFPNWRWFNGE